MALVAISSTEVAEGAVKDAEKLAILLAAGDQQDARYAFAHDHHVTPDEHQSHGHEATLKAQQFALNTLPENSDQPLAIPVALAAPSAPNGQPIELGAASAVQPHVEGLADGNDVQLFNIAHLTAADDAILFFGAGNGVQVVRVAQGAPLEGELAQARTAQSHIDVSAPLPVAAGLASEPAALATVSPLVSQLGAPTYYEVVTPNIGQAIQRSLSLAGYTSTEISHELDSGSLIETSRLADSTFAQAAGVADSGSRVQRALDAFIDHNPHISVAVFGREVVMVDADTSHMSRDDFRMQSFELDDGSTLTLIGVMPPSELHV